MLRLLCLAMLLCLMLLQSCQYHTESASRQSARKRNEAASWNVQLGLAYLKQGSRSRAKQKLIAALDLSPDLSEANGAMAYYLEKTGELKDADIFYQKALMLAPRSGAQLNNYGAFLCRNGQYRKAEYYFLQAVKDVRYVHTAAAYENAGFCAAQEPDLIKAGTYFAKALEQDPGLKQSLYELVSIAMKKNNTDQALDYLNKYREQVIKDATLLAMAIDLAHKLGKKDIEEYYRRQVSPAESTGAKNEYDNPG